MWSVEDRVGPLVERVGGGADVVIHRVANRAVERMSAQVDSEHLTGPAHRLGFAAGGALDAMSRVVADALREGLGQPFISENRAGAEAASKRSEATLRALTSAIDDVVRWCEVRDDSVQVLDGDPFENPDEDDRLARRMLEVLQQTNHFIFWRQILRIQGYCGGRNVC